MELGLSLGDSSRPLLGFMEKPREATSNQLGLGFNTTLSIGPIITRQKDHQQDEDEEYQEEEEEETKPKNNNTHRIQGPDGLSSNPNNNNNTVLHQLDLLPQLALPWHPPSENGTHPLFHFYPYKCFPSVFVFIFHPISYTKFL